MFKILNELVEIPINDRLIPADRRTRGGHNQAYINTSELTPHWDKILFGIELSLIGILFRQLPQNRKLWQNSRVSWSTRSASLFPPPLQPDTPQWRTAGVLTQRKKKESMLAHRLRRWRNTDSTPGELPVPAGMCQKEKERKVFHAWRHRGQRQTVTHVQELSIS